MSIRPALKRSLDDVVVSCVNSVGVELNTASKHLLTYVSGLNARAAGEHRRAGAMSTAPFAPAKSC